jgi:hypothetical protein
MFFSSKELTDLVVESIQENHPEERSIHQLIYLLHFPTHEVPSTIAEILCSNEGLLIQQDRLGKRLAWGHVEDLSQFRDIEVRANRQLRISRQLNRIVLYLAEQKAPSTIGEEFSSLLDRFVHMLHFFDARKENAQLAYAAEEVLLLEKILESFVISQELANKFLLILFERLKPQQIKTVALSLRKRLSQCLKDVEHTESDEITKKVSREESLILPSHTLPFKESLRKLDEFHKLCTALDSLLENYTGHLPQVH